MWYKAYFEDYFLLSVERESRSQGNLVFTLVPRRAGYSLEDLGNTLFSRQVKVQKADVDYVLMALTENCHLVSPLLAGWQQAAHRWQPGLNRVRRPTWVPRQSCFGKIKHYL